MQIIKELTLESSRDKIMGFLWFMIFVQGCTLTFIRTPTIIKNREAGTPLLFLVPLLLLGFLEKIFSCMHLRLFVSRVVWV